MKKLLKTFTISVIVLIGGCGALLFMLGVPQSLARRHHFDRLVMTCDHKALLSIAIPLIQAATNQVVYARSHSRHPSTTKLPPIIWQMSPRTVVVEPGQLRMEFHGGFDHFGFLIRQREEWELTWYTEQGHHDLLRIPIEETREANNPSHHTAGSRAIAQPPAAGER